MRNAEEKLLLSVLSDVLHQRPTVIDESEEVSLTGLYQLAEAQSVTGLVCSQIRTLFPAEELKGFESAFAMQVVTAKKRIRMEAQVSEALKQEGLFFLFVKGCDLRWLYPDPVLRTMGDSDLIVEPQDMEQADAVLQRLGFTKYADGVEWKYERNGMKLELHDGLFEERDGMQDSAFLNNYREYCIQDEKGDYHLSDAFHLAYLYYHMSYHITVGGVGFRQFMDIVLLSRQLPDMTQTDQYLSKIHLLEFAGVVRGLIQRFFAIEMAGAAVIDEAFYQEVFDGIFRGGVFGYGADENRFKRLAMTHEDVRKAKRSYALSRLFPSMQAMKNLRYLSWMKGRVWLYPAGWIYRLVYVLAHPEKREAFAKKAGADNGTIEHNRELLGKWGLRK